MDEQGKTHGKFLAQYCPGVVGGEDLVAKRLNEIPIEAETHLSGPPSKKGPRLTLTQLLIVCCLLLNLALFAFGAHLLARIEVIHNFWRVQAHHAADAQSHQAQAQSPSSSDEVESRELAVLLGREKRQSPVRCATTPDIEQLQNIIRGETHLSVHLGFPSQRHPERLTNSQTYTWTNDRKNFSLHNMLRLSSGNTLLDIHQAGHYYVYGQVTITRREDTDTAAAVTCCYIVCIWSASVPNKCGVHLFTIMATLPAHGSRQESVYSGGTFYLREDVKLHLKPEGSTTYSCSAFTTPDKTFFGAFMV